jgi:hypothetical protein
MRRYSLVAALVAVAVMLVAPASQAGQPPGTLGSPQSPNGILAPFWTDLDGTGADGIRIGTLTDGSDTWIVVDWRVNVFGTTNLRTFEVWIGVTGDANPGEDITYAYDAADLPADPAGHPFVVGVENLDGSSGDSIVGLPTGDLRVTSGSTPPNPPSVSITPGSSPPGGYLPLSLFGITPFPVGDEDVLTFSVPEFVFNGTTHTRIAVSTNGYIDVDGPVSPAEKIADLQLLLASFNLPKGINNALNKKLQHALDALAVGDTAGACDSLQSFLNQVKAQNGKKLTATQAQQLTDLATEIRTQLGC